jgi:hypothetical protein
MRRIDIGARAPIADTALQKSWPICDTDAVAVHHLPAFPAGEQKDNDNRRGQNDPGQPPNLASAAII